eukprot:PITA_10319
MFLQETKCNSPNIISLGKKLGTHMEIIDIESQGREGGLATIWDARYIQMLSSEANKHFLVTVFQPIGNSNAFLCINVYSPQKLEDKLSFLDNLHNIIRRYPSSKCIFGGDFNMITTLLEKKGGLRKLGRDAEAFVSFIESTKLVDVIPKSGSFTWNNRRGGDKLIASRLDRFLISESILLDGTIIESDILPSGGSDHWPVSLMVEVSGTPRNKPFRFEKFWLDHPNFQEMIKKCWSEPLEGSGSKMFNLQRKLKLTKQHIKDWNKNVFGNIFQEKIILENKLEQLHKQGIGGNLSAEALEQERLLSQQWHSRCAQEETLWKQKSRIQWLKEGEMNTKFFHRTALDRRSNNRILELKSETGEMLKNHNEISARLTDHFKLIAQEPHINKENVIKDLTEAIPRIIIADQNWALCRKITMEEIEEAIRSMPNDKAPGSDGFTINFYKACWNTVKQDVWEVVEDSRRSGTILKSLNSTFLALIPKTEEAKTPDKFRPIALCNVIYKIISKLIASRMKTILPGIISEEQSGYVEGRQIFDNILLAQEMIHSLHSRKIAGMLMQLDLSKAYDKVSWRYLEAILKAFGFCSSWINWVMALIRSPRYSILINGAPSGFFAPSRGIRQGDPLSPFLFIILMEGLSRTIAKRQVDGKIQGLKPIRSLRATTHQQFVDDTMLHGTPTVKEAVAYREILDLFSQASGMDINFSKSTIFFFNTHPTVQSHLARLLGFRISSLPSKYLGAPLSLKPWKKELWEGILANLKKKCSLWTVRALNLSGRLVLAKAVLQAIPHYLLSLLPAPKGILQQIRNIQRTFLWSGNGEKKKWALVAWNKLCMSKSRGGLNLVDPEVLNCTCGAKLWWRWIENPTLPWAKHWKEKYVPDCDAQDLIRLQDTPDGSPIWNHAKQNKNLVQENSFWEIRNVNQYWQQHSTNDNWREWINFNSELSEDNNHTAQTLNASIFKRKIRKTEENDKLRWGLKGNGNYSLKEARNILEKDEQGEIQQWHSKVWDNLLWSKIRTFLWLLMRNKTLTWDNIHKKGFVGPSRCPMCLRKPESLNHLFNTCDWADQLWRWMEDLLSNSDRQLDSIHDTILNWRTNFSGTQRVNNIWKSAPGFLLWSIWKERNRRIFQDEVRNINFSKDSILSNIQQLIHAKCRTHVSEKPIALDLRILKNFRLDVGNHNSVLPQGNPHSHLCESWQCPPDGGIKLNFDGASRGNPGSAGIGGVFRNQKGEILHIYYRALGESTNNEMEFAALEHGLRIAKSRNFHNLIAEGDSSLVITTVQKLQRGIKANKAIKHWRLAKVTESIEELLRGLQGTVLHAIRRRANKVADYLANCGVDSQGSGWDSCWEEVNCQSLKDRCAQLAQQDVNTTDQA